MKKTLIVLGVFLLLAGLGTGGYLVVKGKKQGPTPTPTPEVFVETTLEERPFVSLTPSSDGHWLTLAVSRIQDADSFEYELTYETDEGVTQGAVGGPFNLKGKTTYEKEILLGTESSGKFRYHEGVEQGTLMVRLEGGPGPRKFVTEFYLKKGPAQLASVDNQFGLAAKFSSSQFYLLMPTVGLPAEFDQEVASGPYGVFGSGSQSISAATLEPQPEGNPYFFDGKQWQDLTKKSIGQIGVFVFAAEEIEEPAESENP